MHSYTTTAIGTTRITQKHTIRHLTVDWLTLGYIKSHVTTMLSIPTIWHHDAITIDIVEIMTSLHLMYQCSYLFTDRTYMCLYSASVSAFTSARLEFRSATPAGNCTVWNTEFSQMDCRWVVARQLPRPPTPALLSSVRPGLDREFHAQSSSI